MLRTVVQVDDAVVVRVRGRQLELPWRVAGVEQARAGAARERIDEQVHPVDEPVREHPADERRAAADVQVAADRLLEPAERTWISPIASSSRRCLQVTPGPGRGRGVIDDAASPLPAWTSWCARATTETFRPSRCCARCGARMPARTRSSRGAWRTGSPSRASAAR